MLSFDLAFVSDDRLVTGVEKSLVVPAFASDAGASPGSGLPNCWCGHGVPARFVVVEIGTTISKIQLCDVSVGTC